MSHWVKKTANVLENVKQHLLIKACADLGVSFDTNIKHVKNTYGENANVDAGIIMNGKCLPLGFIFKKENDKTKLMLEGDFWNTGLNERTFINLLSQSYQKYNIVEQVEQNGWLVDVNKIDNDGNVVIEAYQWA